MTVPTTPGQRFTQLIQQLGLTKNAFAQSLGKTATVIQHIVDERNKPGFGLLNKVCEVYPNVASDWLVLGKGPMLRDGTPPPLLVEAAASSPTPTPNGIDLSEVPHTSRRRNGALLQPADIAATLALATHSPAAHPAGQNGHAPISGAPAAPAANSTIPEAASPRPAVPPAAAPASIPTSATSAAPTPAAPPDPAYLAAALQTQYLQHQLALAEQRNLHLLEQQALLRQLVEVLQRV